MEEQNTIGPFGSGQEAQEDATEKLQQIIQSGESVTLEQAQPMQQAPVAVEYAGFWARFAAVFVDGLVLIIPSFIASIIFGKNLGFFMQYILMWTYAIYMLNTRQATLGKMAVGIKVVAVNGENQTIGKLALREIVGKILNILTVFVGYVMIAFTAKKQGLHDMIADTVVVYDPTRKRRGWLVVLGIVFALVIPVMGILAGIVLVATGSAKDKANKAAVVAYGSSIIPEIIICEADGGNVNPCGTGNCSNVKICSDSNHTITWPDITKTGWKFNAPAGVNKSLSEYKFTITKSGMADIKCDTTKCE